ncbi:MAG: hypothetical protein N2999_00755 [Proteobacteria bacterium]|nr:hypothetical protein [Pseudomonadota bacterium]
MKKYLIFILLAMFTLVSIGYSQRTGEGVYKEEGENPHEGYVKSFEGTKTCLECHEKEAKDVFHSTHYQWKTDTSDVVGGSGKKLGKINVINDFCTGPWINWIFDIKNKGGKIVTNGCSKCHAGLGLMPSETMSQEQLENIDCLICHAPGYNRKVVNDNGKLRWAPADEKDVLLVRAQNVQKPKKGMCLRCHAGAGGGFNFKRGDIEAGMVKADKDLDVHLAGGLNCVDCHKSKEHRISGRGVDLAGRDNNEFRPTCDTKDCHGNKPHSKNVLNKHTASLDCTVCHIPEFAKREKTDMERNWAHLEYLKDADKYEPEIKFQKNVIPVYAWWNGRSFINDPEKPIKDTKTIFKMAKPDGSIKDTKSKIYAFKLHKANLPYDTETKRLIPVATDIAFLEGNVDKAIKEGAKRAFGKELQRYDFVKTERYMGIFHGVSPKEKALKCNDCHSEKGRIDFKALGYKGDPMKVGGRFSKK